MKYTEAMEILSQCGLGAVLLSDDGKILSINKVGDLLLHGGGELGNGGTLNFITDDNRQYTLYIGTNDKDTYEQIITTDEAVDIVNAIVSKYVGGYTMHHARGGWVDEKGILTQENTLVYTISYSAEDDVRAIMDEILIALNQNSILIERQEVSSVFYNGNAQ